MKKTASALMLTAAVLTTPALAQYAGPGAQPAATSVQAILDKPVDDQHVTLRGKIVRQVKSDEYIFSDGKAEIRVEIDQRLLPATPFDASTVVEISGEVEQDAMRAPEIDVRALRIVK
ncbi:NirD/YgiW/YdeI family stress tolerance protein [Vandammella animalimorsus]|uniref:NirD/YgiW/YdeI family stress tolerance protein n=1 Tax=Vandammella animalimorsus TaxID=2029117 RepID=A0A3M6R6B7_9BURK|nr:NirD/YgiW/YdeI family stress tolerance protein [Vandammella animalimorsus]RMX10775.1 NirD/YgiW/YdeI family stress tolerance protein [Vandammella animalimorsus]